MKSCTKHIPERLYEEYLQGLQTAKACLQK